MNAHISSDDRHSEEAHWVQCAVIQAELCRDATRGYYAQYAQHMSVCQDAGLSVKQQTETNAYFISH